MASYLLLRDNKQKGPYNLDELIILGLKPYDLVWVEGRSAAWRYPSEVSELKPYAPIVEEQPFDRFFKKEEVTSTAVNSTHSETIKEKRNIQNESATILPVEQASRKVFVSFPGAGAGKKATETSRKDEVLKPVENKPVFSEQKYYQPQYGNDEHVIPEQHKDYLSYSKHLLQKDDYADAEDKVVRLEKRFSQPLDEIKDMYVQTLVDRKKKIARKKTVAGVLRKAAVPAFILALGVMIGVAVNGFSFGKPEVTAKTSAATGNLDNKPPVTDAVDNAGAEEEQLSTSEPVSNNEIIRLPDDPSMARGNLNTFEKTALLSKQEKTVASGNESDEQLVGEPEPFQNSSTVNGERQKAVRSVNNEPVLSDAGNSSGEKSEASTMLEDRIRKQVTVKSNDYRRGSFGGIFDLKLTVNNATQYELNEVIVELQYLKPSEQPLKTETVSFKAIPPNQSSTINIPPSSRGIKVAYHITKIKYKDRGETALND